VYSYADTLPDKRKEIFLLHIKNKLSTKEIAAMLGISQKTVQNQLRTAQIGLRPHIATILALLIASH
jgi:RNA polymerase sigma-70 factor (ECF subfamily)